MGRLMMINPTLKESPLAQSQGLAFPCLMLGVLAISAVNTPQYWCDMGISRAWWYINLDEKEKYDIS